MKTQQLMGIVIAAVVYSLGLCSLGPCFLGTMSTLQAQQLPGARAAASAARGKSPAKAATVNDAAEGKAEAGKKTTDAVAEDAPNETADAAAKAAEAQKKQQRLQKIQQLQFDRRPSTILKTWSERDEKPKDAGNDAEKPKSETGEPVPQPDPFDQEIKVFQRHVTLGQWVEVKRYLAGLPEDEGKALYQRLLLSLRSVPKPTPAAAMPGMPVPSVTQRGGRPEKNTFTFEDVIALADAAPVELDDKLIVSLGAILREALGTGNVVKELVARLKEEIAKPEDDAALNERQAAQLLFGCGRAIEAGEFLPDVEKATTSDDFEALNLLSRYYLALHAEEREVEHLEEAWRVLQAVLASSETEKAEREQALQRAVGLAPKIREELGEKWLEESFTGQPERGMEILASIGATAARAMQTQARSPNSRLTALQLQTTAVESLLQSSPDLAGEWSDALNLLAGNWLSEALVSYQYDQSTRRGPSLRRDSYGNYFYYNQDYYGSSRSSNRLQPIKTGDLLDIKPSDRWLELVSVSLKPKFDMVFAQLHLKVNEEDSAFPYIEELAKVYPDMAEDLVDEFLRVWTNNHDPNSSRNRTNHYMFMYGYERKAESIPLTRSKQERNLQELAALVKRLRALPLEELNEALLARAFTRCHSAAEVYRLESIEKVFGALENVEPKTLAELSQQMRANLVGVWRQPAVQKDKKTKRKQKDIQREVLRGYEVARRAVRKGLEKHPDHWALELARASIDHDENNYKRELANDSEFSKRLGDAFAGFKKAADLYVAGVGDLREDEETTKVFELWYYASLGACDLQHVDSEKVPDLRQPARIREAILALPGEAAERHLAIFANTLFTRMSAVKPAVKYRYVRTGLEIVGDHKQAREARKVFDYYKDLVTEIKLETVIDGSAVVGHTEPFGVFVNLRHTREIERESGGFGRYLQNQNTGSYYYYNYGRPLENYRDKFEEIVRQAAEEHFEILSVTFQTEKVNSRAVEEYGWRVTPYAYLLLKPRGAEVDKIPSVRLDLDFLDTSGYAIIPVESPALPIDASSEKGEARPLEKLAITQTLDERQADEGKLILEVKATAQGLVPKLDELLTLGSEGFEITGTEDQGLSVSRFDPESDETVVVSERTWMVTFQALDDLSELPKTFRFPEAKLDIDELVYQRYDDADLLAVESTIDLEERYGAVSYAWVWFLAGIVLVGAGILFFGLRAARRRPAKERSSFEMPESLTPFTLLGRLRDIQQNNGLGDDGKQELAASIGRLEEHFFLRGDTEAPDLQEIGESWIRRTR